MILRVSFWNKGSWDLKENHDCKHLTCSAQTDSQLNMLHRAVKVCHRSYVNNFKEDDHRRKISRHIQWSILKNSRSHCNSPSNCNDLLKHKYVTHNTNKERCIWFFQMITWSCMIASLECGITIVPHRVSNRKTSCEHAYEQCEHRVFMLSEV